MNPNQNIIESQIYDTAIRACTDVSEDSYEVLKVMLDRESNPTARSILQAMVDNVMIAKATDNAICQSPGYPTSWLSFGDENIPLHVADVVKKAIVDGTKKGYLRPSLVDPLTRINEGNNLGLGIPNIEYEYNPGQPYVDFIISLKGCGAELPNAFTVMPPAAFGRDYAGLARFIVETALAAGGKPCTPFAIGVGLGGQMDIAAKLSRKAVSTRRWDDVNSDPVLAKWEMELKDRINSLGIGAAGIGGDRCCLAVKIAKSATHTAILPVAVNFHCWVARRAGIRIHNDGHVDKLL